MAQIAITLADQPDGRVNVAVYLDGVVEGQPSTPAQVLAKAMLRAASEESSQVTDLPVKH
jgi:hypothetical protein